MTLSKTAIRGIISSPFLNPNRQLRSIWWVAVFFLVLAILTLPVIFLSQYYKFEVTIFYQAVIVMLASGICQLWRKKPISDLTGAFSIHWIKGLFTGMLAGAALMVIPSIFLLVSGRVSWQIQQVDFSSLVTVTLVSIGVAIAEELLFRGFIFQRLIHSIGEWPAQMIIAAYFLLIHINNPGMTGNVRLIAGINIFLASIMFGLAFIRTKSLAMPIGIHFMANWVQGTVLGFGVSGNEQAGLLRPVFADAPVWLTGGAFGLEASIPGLVCVFIAIIFLYRWAPAEDRD